MHQVHQIRQSSPLDELSCTSPNTHLMHHVNGLTPISFPIRTSSRHNLVQSIHVTNILQTTIASSPLLSNHMCPWYVLLDTRVYNNARLFFASSSSPIQTISRTATYRNINPLSRCKQQLTHGIWSLTLVQSSICRKSPAASRAAVKKHYLQ